MINLPDLIDNRDGNTLASTLGAFLRGKLGHRDVPGEVCIATAFFNLSGFAHIAHELERVSSVRLLLGVDPATKFNVTRKPLDQSKEKFEWGRMKTELRNMEDSLQRERDRLPFTRASSNELRRLISLLTTDSMEVRRYEKTFLHAKAYIINPTNEAKNQTEGIIVGSSNLTDAGLTRNLELNLGCYDSSVVEQAQQWFNDLWDDATPYDLTQIFKDVLHSRTPWEIFIRVLWQLYGSEVENDSLVDDNLPLTTFQKHGVARALRLIEEIGGVIVADEVGLGKTFVAGEILQRYRRQRQRALLICPAALRDSTWKGFLNTYQLFVECLSFEQLAGDIQLRDAQRPNANQQHLQRPLDEYQLVIVDEAHNYRNPNAPTRAAALRRLLFGHRRDLLLLTATPVNNSLWDLYHLMRFFLRQDAHLASRGILSIRERFERAIQQDPSSLSPDILYPIIDATTVKRTRQFVKKHYSRDTITGPDGIPQQIIFPRPEAISIRYNLDDFLPGFFDQLERALDPSPNNDASIAFARYMPENYLLEQDNEETARSHALVGLLRSALLKRFESSAFAFRKTIMKMVEQHGLFLDALKSGYVVTTTFLNELSADDEAVFEDLLENRENRTDASHYDTESLRLAVEHDLGILQELANKAAKITQDQDPKLKVLADALKAIAVQAEREAINAIDEAQKRKVLVFSFFEDTVEWIRDYLKVAIDTPTPLENYRNRMVVVSGSGELSTVSRQKAVQGFAPVSMGAPPSHDEDLYDLIVATDVLAEGVNLQQCRNIINFDMPWNPMRLVQRHGRIDRIGSPHNRVFLRTIFPVDQLDQLLNLEQRILDKIAIAAASVGVEAPIEGAVHGRQVFTETREEIEKLLGQDASLFERGGTTGAAQTGEEYRQTLRKALSENRDQIFRLPWKIGSGMMKGKQRGVFFCAVVGVESKFERTYLRFIPADDNWSPKSDKGELEREFGTCLRLIECNVDTPLWFPSELQEQVYDFWETARDDIWHDWMRQTDPANLQPKVRPLNHRVAEFIRTNPPLGVSQNKVTRALDILESPWPRREEIMLRGWFQSDKRNGSVLSKFLINEIIETGLEPVEPPSPLPPIQLEDIELLCWLGIESITTDSEKD